MKTIARTLILAMLLVATGAAAQILELNENCTVSILNRAVQVQPDGSWVLPNVPTNIGLVRARATCVENGVTKSGQSEYFAVPPAGTVFVPSIRLDQPMAPIPATLVLTAPSVSLSAVGATVAVRATATYANGTSANLSLQAQGTNWFTSNPRIATVSADGLVTAVSTGTALISAMNEGALGMLAITIVTSGDSDGDGLPDQFEIDNGLDPGNAADAAGDLDGDGLSNVDEFRRGTGLRVPDSDGDGLSDGNEVSIGTNPLLADTDGDGVRDGLEVQTGSNPLDPASYNLRDALQSIAVNPAAFEIVVNTLLGEGSRLVAVTGTLRDGTSINLTARSRGTSYTSSNLQLLSFGTTDGQIFGGTGGTATLTVTNNGHTATAAVTVRNFGPQQVSVLRMPGYANNVAVAGNYAYVAAGSAGLVVVNVTNRATPVIAGTIDTPGNANDVRVVSNYAYVADGAGGLQIIDVSNPAAPRIVGSYDTPGVAWDVAVAGGRAYIADGASGLQIVDVRNPATPVLLGSMDTPGTAKGIDLSGILAVIADGGATLVVDISIPTTPVATGAAPTGDARDLVAEGSLAYVADYQQSIRVVDFSNPAAPRIVAATDRDLGGIATGTAKVGPFVFASDILFVNGVSITDVRNPSLLAARGRIDFTPRDDAGTGLTADQQFVYLTAASGYAENGTSGDSVLYIGQFLFAEDTAGSAPVVSLTSPQQQPTVAEGALLRLAANATDDVLVARVEFHVNGEVVAIDAAEPYEFDYRVPAIPSLTIFARAYDVAGNAASTTQVILTVIPDPGTTAVGRTILENGTPVVGATVTCSGRSAASGANGAFSVTSVPTIAGSIRCTATANDLDGTPLTGATAGLSPIPGGQTQFGNLILRSALQVVQHPKTLWQVEDAFRARNLAKEGQRLVVTSNRLPDNTGSSSRVVVFDITQPTQPVRSRTLDGNNSFIHDVEVQNGWIYSAGGDFCTLSLTDPAAAKNCVSFGGDEFSVAVSGSYAFTGTLAGDGRIRVWDVSDPASPRFVREQAMASNINFSDLMLYGTKYLVATSADAPGGAGHDVVIIEMLDINHFTIAGRLDIPDFSGFRGEVRGDMLYLNGRSNDWAIVDLSNVVTPRLVGRRTANGFANGVWPAANELFVAAGTAGVARYDITNPVSPVESGTINSTGIAFDVILQGNVAYIVNESGLAVASVSVPPQIERNRISLGRDGSMAVVRGEAGAILGQPPVSIGVRNLATGAAVSGIAVAADGSFTATLPAAANEPIELEAIDSVGRRAGPLRLGTVPFGNARFYANPALAGNSFRARTLAIENNLLAVGGWSDAYGANGNAVLYDVTDPANPIQLRTVQAVSGALQDLEVSGGWGFATGGDFCTFEFASPQATTRNCVSFGGDELGLAVAGRYAYTGTAAGDGRVRVWDVSDPAAPRFLREQALIANVNFWDLLPYGDTYLIGISPNQGAGVDVAVINRRDVNNFILVATLNIPNYEAYRGRISGSKLYLGAVRTSPVSGMAIVDLSNPASPQFLGYAHTGGRTHGVDVSGTIAATADGPAGVTFSNVANPAATAVTGQQFITGSAWDVRFRRGAVFVAAENGLAVISAVAAPPIVDVARIAIAATNATTATVTGVSTAITGEAPLTAKLRNLRTNAESAAVNVAGDGSFVGTIPARSGDVLAVLATDTNGRVTGPVTIGAVPFGSGTVTLILPPAQVGNSFRARTLAGEGNLLAVGGWSDAFGANGNVSLFDITNPATPSHLRTVQAVSGSVMDVEIVNGWGFVSGGDFCTFQFANPAATARNCVSFGGDELGVAVAGRYAFTSTAAGDGRIRIWDVANPALPRFLREQSTIASVDYLDVIAYGDQYLVAVSNSLVGSVTHDVVVFDRRDVNNLIRIADLDIPAFRGFRGRIYGNTLYLAGANETTGLAVVDLTNPASPQLKSIIETGGRTRGASATGTTVVTADGSLGVSFIDASTPTAPSIIGSQFTGGNAWDTLLRAGTLYVANEQGVVVIRDVIAAPIVETTLITVAVSTPTTAAVLGAARSITGQAPITVELRNTATGATVAGVPVQADGSFSATIAGRSGEVIALVATDANGRVTGPVILGPVPFGGNTTTILIPPSQTSAAFRARTLAAENNLLAVGGFAADYGASSHVALYDITTPSSPALLRTVDAVNGSVYDIELAGGWGYIAGGDFCTFGFGIPAEVEKHCVSFGGDESGVAVANGYAFTSTFAGDGRIRIWDVSIPAAPRFLREQSTASNVDYWDVVSYGDQYLIGISPSEPGGIGNDVVVFNRRDVNSLIKVAELQIPNFRGFRGRVSGNRLYVSSFGATTGMAVVDLTDPANPQLRSVVETGGRTRGVSVVGNTAITADGSIGVSFTDVSDPSSPLSKGRQFVGGNTWDVVANGGALFVANELGFVAISDAALAPVVDAARVAVSAESATSAKVLGAARSISGKAPVLVDLRNAATGVITPGLPVNADGSFLGNIAARSGEVITVTATDAAGRANASYLVGPVPFGSATQSFVIPPATTGGSFRARTLAAENNVLVVGGWGEEYGANSRALVFDVTNPAAPQYLRTVDATNGQLYDIELAGGWGYIAGGDFCTFEFGNPADTKHCVSFGGDERGVAARPPYAFTSTAAGDGRIRIWNVSNPLAPVFLREQAFIPNADYWDVIAYGTDYLVAISPSEANGVGHDLVVFDRRNINALVKIADLDIAGTSFRGYRGRIYGTTLYIASASNGTTTAIVDLSNPASPQLRALVDGGGRPRGATFGGSLAIFGQGSPGVSFFDVANPAAPVLRGKQFVSGNVWDVLAHGPNLYVANEHGLAVIRNIDAPWSNAFLRRLTPSLLLAGRQP